MLDKSFVTKIRKLCMSIISKDIPLRIDSYENKLLYKIGNKSLKNIDEKNTLVKNIILHDVLNKAKKESMSVNLIQKLQVVNPTRISKLIWTNRISKKT